MSLIRKIPTLYTGPDPVDREDLLGFGTTANDLVQLDATGKLPAVDGSLLTGMSAGGGATDPTVRVAWSQAGAGNIAPTTAGMSGTPFTQGGTSRTAIFGADGIRLECISSPTIASWAGFFAGSSSIPAILIASHHVIRTGRLATDLQNVRIWVGLGTNALLSDALNPSTNSQKALAFRYSTEGANTGFWECVSSNGVTDTATVTSVPVAPDTKYTMKITVNAAANSFGFFINGTLVATHNATTAPASSDSLLEVAKAVTLVNAAKEISWYRSASEFRY